MKAKIAVIGAGSYVFGPSMLKQAMMDNRLDDVELALMDVDAGMVSLMSDVARATAKRQGMSVKVTGHSQRATALDGADFVVCSAAVQGIKRSNMDADAIHRIIPDYPFYENGGLQGISYALRQIALTEQIVQDMRRSCPNAWLLTVANPLPRVCQAAHELGVQTAGFCSAASGFFSVAWRLLQEGQEKYPWSNASAIWDFKAAGLNHFAFLLEFRDQATGQDLTPALTAAIQAGKTSGNPVCERFFRNTGVWLLPCDKESRDFLAPDGLVLSQTGNAFHGDPAQRQRRLDWLAQVVSGDASLADLPSESWEKPVELIISMLGGAESKFRAVNLINRGQISNLPAGVFVETPAIGTSSGPVPENVTLPDAVLPYATRAAALADTVIRAALERKRSLVYQAVELDPTILDKTAGRQAIDECMKAHADLLPEYS
jgi:alpha-galactosidase